ATVQASNAGPYFVVVSDSTHSITSAPAVLTVLDGPGPLITEFMAANSGALLDEDGDTSDWIEIYNAGSATVNLQGWCLTDHATNLTKWRFPSTNIAAHGFLVVYASGKDRA